VTAARRLPIDWRLAAALAAYAVAATLFVRFTLDDAGITLRHAWNLAHHGVLSFNADQRVYGTSSVAWALLCTPLMAVDAWLSPLALAGGLSFVCGGLAVVMVHRLARAMAAPAYVIVMSVAALSLPCVAFAWSGMEVGLSVALLAGFVAAFLAPPGAAPLRRMAWLGVAGFFTRPDQVLITVPLFAVALLRRRGRPRAELTGLIAPALVAVAGLAGLALYYGSVVPTSWSAKILDEARDPGLLAGLRRIGLWLVVQGVAAPLLLAAGWAWLRRRDRDDGRVAGAALVLAAVVLLGAFASQGGSIVMDDLGRYYLPGLLVLAVAAARSIDAGVRSGRSALLRRVSQGLAALTPALLIAGLWVGWRHDMNLGTQPAYRRSIADYTGWMNDAYLPLGRYLAAHYPPSTTLMVRDAGLIPLYSRFDRVLDIWSLDEPRIIACRRACSRQVVRDFDPDLVVQGDELIDDFASRYREVRRFSAAGRTLVLWQRR